MIQEIKALMDKNLPLVSNLANASAFLYSHYENLNWAGFYLAKDNVLYLGPFQGEIACTYIPFSIGICGRAATQKKTIIVDNVLEDRDHIACSSASRSEIVVPIIKDDVVYGVLDIDSPIFSRFGEKEKKELEAVIDVLKDLF